MCDQGKFSVLFLIDSGHNMLTFDLTATVFPYWDAIDWKGLYFSGLTSTTIPHYTDNRAYAMVESAEALFGRHLPLSKQISDNLHHVRDASGKFPQPLFHSMPFVIFIYLFAIPIFMLRFL